MFQQANQFFLFQFSSPLKGGGGGEDSLIKVGTDVRAWASGFGRYILPMAIFDKKCVIFEKKE